ncbi:MAG: PleD family two-component system response regulator [Anaerolineales bacterium]
MKDDDSTNNSPYNVLVVDDDPSAIRMAMRALEPLGDVVKIATATDGFEAGLQIIAFAPDLLILDLMMPGADGFEVCRRIRRDPDLAEIKILILTAHGTHKNLQRVLDAGANDFMHKPIDVGRLEERVRTLLEIDA